MTPTVTATVVSEDRVHHRQSSKKFFCKICLSDCPFKKGTTLATCSCVFCKQCLKQYLAHAISDGNVLRIPCPDGKCTRNGEITTPEMSHLITDDQFHTFLRLKTIKEIQIDKSKTFCPNPGCEGVCEGMPGTAQQVFCKDCGNSFCFGCKDSWHPNRTCKESKTSGTETTTGIKLIEIVKGEEGTIEIKECPICQVLIQRDEGCAQMMCGNCKHIFCWHCRKSLDSDIMLRHYDKGPCRNKLGHSRTTLFLHRTQVVAGFVFFGAMIVVASPFLLLISPCFLLSKCLFREKKSKS